VEQKQKARLEWFLDFLKADLSKLSAGKRLLMIARMAVSLGFSDEEQPIPEHVPWGWLDQYRNLRRQDLQSTQRRLIKVFDNIMETFQDVKGCQETMEGNLVPTEKDSALRSLTAIPLEVRMTPLIALELIPDGDWDAGIASCERVKWAKHAVERASLRVNTLATNPQDTFLYYFLQSLDGLSLEALRQCEECEGWFLHSSKRERRFCSSRCATKHANRERYNRIKDEQPERLEAERKKGRERAHKSYEKRVKAVHPKAQVARRPRTGKGKEV